MKYCYGIFSAPSTNVCLTSYSCVIIAFSLFFFEPLKLRHSTWTFPTCNSLSLYHILILCLKAKVMILLNQRFSFGSHSFPPTALPGNSLQWIIVTLSWIRLFNFLNYSHSLMLKLQEKGKLIVKHGVCISHLYIGDFLILVLYKILLRQLSLAYNSSSP